jgi:hypothetical protein
MRLQGSPTYMKILLQAPTRISMENGTIGSHGPDIPLYPKKWNERLSTNIWSYSTLVFLVYSVVNTYVLPVFGLEPYEYQRVLFLLLSQGCLLSWVAAFYSESFYQNAYRKWKKANGKNGNNLVFAISFWFIMSLFFLGVLLLGVYNMLS